MTEEPPKLYIKKKIYSGVVKWFSIRKGFGVIIVDDPCDLGTETIPFINRSIANSTINNYSVVFPGDSVTFRISMRWSRKRKRIPVAKHVYVTRRGDKYKEFEANRRRYKWQI